MVGYINNANDNLNNESLNEVVTYEELLEELHEIERQINGLISKLRE